MRLFLVYSPSHPLKYVFAESFTRADEIVVAWYNATNQHPPIFTIDCRALATLPQDRLEAAHSALSSGGQGMGHLSPERGWVVVPEIVDDARQVVGQSIVNETAETAVDWPASRHRQLRRHRLL